MPNQQKHAGETRSRTVSNVKLISSSRETHCTNQAGRRQFLRLVSETKKPTLKLVECGTVPISTCHHDTRPSMKMNFGRIEKETSLAGTRIVSSSESKKETALPFCNVVTAEIRTWAAFLFPSLSHCIAAQR